ncbi:MAG: Uma2 family endonuclease, partial [Thermomicrobium sp.]|nr:Uma2 family endonuclease [Thermomicrobium sp.]
MRAWGGWVRPAPLQDDPSWYETGLSEDELIGILPARSIGEESGEDLPPDVIEFLTADEDDADRSEPEEPEDPEAALSPAGVVLLPEPGVCSTRPSSIPQWAVDEKAADRLRDRRTVSSAVGRSSAEQPRSTSTTRSSGRSAEGESAATGSLPAAKDEPPAAGHVPRGRWDDLAWPLAWLAEQLAAILE